MHCLTHHDMERCWFPAISQDVVKNLKDYVSPLLSGCFPLEHVGAKLCPFWWWVGNESVHGELEVLGVTEAVLESKTVFF